MKHDQFLKIPSILIEKMPMKKGSLVNNSYIFWTDFDSVNTLS